MAGMSAIPLQSSKLILKEVRKKKSVDKPHEDEP
jgi:hypothetical protein